MRKFLFCVLCVFLSVSLFACSGAGDSSQFSAAEKENIIKCVDAVFEHNISYYDEDDLADVYGTYLTLDQSKKEELFDLANSQNLKNYMGKDALEFT